MSRLVSPGIEIKEFDFGYYIPIQDKVKFVPYELVESRYPHKDDYVELCIKGYHICGVEDTDGNICVYKDRHYIGIVSNKDKFVEKYFTEAI
jgi:hypothetical protein